MATDNKYDRQLRLWGSEGQRLLGNSKILVIGASAVSSEILKNLVLPGIGFFTLVDDQLVSESDLGENFFVHPSHLGRLRSEVVKDFLLELNPDVKGEALGLSFSSLLSSDINLQSYTLVIATQLSFSQSKLLDSLCVSNSIPLLLCRSVGLLGYLRVYTPEHLVVESKPSDKELIDLRIHKPFAELLHYSNSIDLSSLDLIYHSHVPFIVILIQSMQDWLKVHPSAPSTFAAKSQFKDLIKSKSKDLLMEDNFQEAIKKSYLATITEDLPEEIQAVLNDDKSLNATKSSPEFWKCAKAVSSFIAANNSPPLTGIFGDMTSDTSSYIKLQTIYSNKAKKDLQEVSRIYAELFEGETSEMLSSFCRNLLTLEVTRMRSLQEELEEMNKSVLDDPDEPEFQLVDWYLALRAIDHHRATVGTWPEVSDIPSLQSYTESICKEADAGVLEEMLRYRDSELHSVSALVAGVASQEAVKLVTKQYSALNNTFLFTGVTSQGTVLSL